MHEQRLVPLVLVLLLDKLFRLVSVQSQRRYFLSKQSLLILSHNHHMVLLEYALSQISNLLFELCLYVRLNFQFGIQKANFFFKLIVLVYLHSVANFDLVDFSLTVCLNPVLFESE